MRLSFLFLVYEDFEGLLQEQVTIDAYIEWLDKIIDKSIVQVCDLFDFIILWENGVNQDGMGGMGWDGMGWGEVMMKLTVIM